MSKLGIVGATVLLLALEVATPAFAVGLRGGGVVHVGNGGFRGAQASIGSVASIGADASSCRHRWAYYDAESRKYMDDGGQWRPCP
jgi:hypothetical protein